MSQALHETIEVPNAAFNTARIDVHQYPPHSAQNQATQGFSNFVDGSGPIFSMYLEMATEEDKKMAEDWKADADGILIFAGLFSAAVASLISVSIQDLRQNPQDTSNFYLANIYRTLADPNGSNVSSSLPTSPPPFSPPKYAVWVNALWFLSLAISLTCALLATFLQQWARRYLRVTHSRSSPHKRARIRAFFFEGVEKCFLLWAVDTLPTLLHISLFLFFTGLVVFLWNVDLTIFKLVLSWVAVCTALYGCITLMPIFRHDSPYYTSLSSSMWPIVTGFASFIFLVSGWLLYFTFFCRRGGEWLLGYAFSYWGLFSQGMQKTIEESVLKSPPEIDTRAFLWTFDILDEDHELERFFSGLPGFRSSKMVKDPLPDLTWEQEEKLLNALIGLLDRTSSSDLLPEQVRNRRAAICAKTINQVRTSRTIWQVFSRIVSEDEHGPVQSAEIARLVRGWEIDNDEATTLVTRAIVSSVVARAQRRDDLWFTMASDEMGVPESVLRDHATHGDSLSLAILIHVTRQQFVCFWKQYWPDSVFSKVLLPASKFNVLDTSPNLQHDFCALWNQIVRKVQQYHDQNMAYRALGRIRNVYVALHEGTDSAPTRFSASTSDGDAILIEPFSYPLCNIPSHHPDSTPHVHDVSASISIPHAILHFGSALVPVSPASTPDAPSSSVPALRVDENCVDVPLLDSNIPSSFKPTRQATMESPRVPLNLSGTETAAGTTLDVETSARTIPFSTPETSTSTTSTPSIGAVSLQNNVLLLVHFDKPEPSSSASPKPVLDDTTEPHCSTPATTSSRTSPYSTSAPTIGAAEGSPKPGSHKNEVALDSLSVDLSVQGNAMAVVDLAVQPPPLPSTTSSEITIAGPSWREPDTGHTAAPAQTSYDQDDIV